MKAHEMAKNIFEPYDQRCAGILTLVSNCFVKMKEYDKALEYMQQVWQISEQHYGFKSESCGLVYLETAKIYGKKEDWPHAIEMQIRAISKLFNGQMFILNRRVLGIETR